MEVLERVYEGENESGIESDVDDGWCVVFGGVQYRYHQRYAESDDDGDASPRAHPWDNDDGDDDDDAELHPLRHAVPQLPSPTTSSFPSPPPRSQREQGN
jgi:hypothetical protein